MTLTLIDRDAWGAAAPTEHIPGHQPCRIVVHHTYRPTIRDWRGEISMRGIQRYHLRDQGWADIAYHYVLAPGGRVYLGRPTHQVGAHCGGAPPKGVTRRWGNTGSIGICVVGDYDQERPIPQMVLDLAGLIARVQADLGLDPTAVYGHFEAWSRPTKTCPGYHLADALGWSERWRQAFGGLPA